MKRGVLKKIVAGAWMVGLGAVHAAWGATNYVDIANLTPSSPFTTPATAATNIQDAIDVAASSNTILVSPGVYSTGGRFYESLTNRIVLSNSVIVMATSTNPADTFIVGAPDPATGTNGPGATRCAYLKDAGCWLIGFTLTNGFTAWADGTTRGAGGGVKGIGVVSNCVITGCWGLYGGGAYRGSLTDCRLVGNQANRGGGMYESTLNNCVVTGCVAAQGGGAYSGVVSNSVIAGCYSPLGAASAYTTYYNNSRITDCTGGFALFGGNLIGSSILNCEAGLNGGVASNSVIAGCSTNCAVSTSTIYGSTISNCTTYGGIYASVYGCTVTNSIITECKGNLAARFSTLYSCVVKNNQGNGALQECTVWDSRIEGNAGRACQGYAYTRCEVVGNTGVYVITGGTFTNSIVRDNGGTMWTTLINCLVQRNATNPASEAHLFRPSCLVNCTVVSNTASTIFGSYSGLSSLTNCIVYHNMGKPFYTGTYVNYSCISSNTGVVGTGNTTNAPQFVDPASDDYRLGGGYRSPCVNKGITLDWMINSVDLAGQPRVQHGVVDMGAYEVHNMLYGTMIAVK